MSIIIRGGQGYGRGAHRYGHVAYLDIEQALELLEGKLAELIKDELLLV